MKLWFTEFEVNYLYGFKIDERKGKSINVKEEYHKELNGWVSPYPHQYSKNKISHVPQYSTGKFEIKKCENLNILKSKKDYSGKFSKDLMLREDGFGTFNFNLTVDILQNDLYNTSDILRYLLLVPRRTYKPENFNFDRLESIPLVNKDQLFSQNISDPFKHFYDSILNINSLVEKGIFQNDFDFIWNEIDNIGYPYALYNASPLIEDFQNPYIYIKAKMPWELYKKLFIDADSSEKKAYSDEIASILIRIYTDKNIDYMSKPYWENFNLRKEYVFENKYLNLLSYVVYSNLCTLMIIPDISDEGVDNIYKNKPIYSIIQGLLKSLKYSKLKLHQSIWLNKQIENFSYRIKEIDKMADLISSFSNFLIIESKVSSLLDTPEQYMWDGTIGRQISDFFYQSLISNVENEVKDKLNHVRNFLQDKKYYLSFKGI